jgi:hypothetical protein
MTIVIRDNDEIMANLRRREMLTLLRKCQLISLNAFLAADQVRITKFLGGPMLPWRGPPP